MESMTLNTISSVVLPQMDVFLVYHLSSTADGCVFNFFLLKSSTVNDAVSNFLTYDYKWIYVSNFLRLLWMDVFLFSFSFSI